MSAGGAFGAGIGTAPGATLNYSMAVIGGAATANASAGGAGRSVSYALVAGLASAAGNANALGLQAHLPWPLLAALPLAPRTQREWPKSSRTPPILATPSLLATSFRASSAGSQPGCRHE